VRLQTTPYAEETVVACTRLSYSTESLWVDNELWFEKRRSSATYSKYSMNICRVALPSCANTLGFSAKAITVVLRSKSGRPTHQSRVASDNPESLTPANMVS